ncbi:MAG TPA: glycosyltransferase family 2 protein [Candidatus Paceibacterota bacterium]
MMTKKLSAIITSYRDEESIPLMYRRLTDVFKTITTSYEIIFVNDASPDNSEAVLAELAARDKHIVVINHARNFNSQNAFSSGMDVATGDAVILLDGDLQDPPELIPQFVAKWQEGFDVVYGVRTKREGVGLIRFFYSLFYRLFKKLSYLNIPLDAGDFSLMDRKVVDVINQMPERDRFIRGLRAWVGFKQMGVPYVRPDRLFGKSNNNLIKNIWWAKKGIFSFSYQPLELISYLGFFIVLASFLLTLVYIVLYFVSPQNTGARGIQTIIFLVLFLGGVQLLSISIIGEYIAKIFEEVKGRPKYIIKSILNDPRL